MKRDLLSGFFAALSACLKTWLLPRHSGQAKREPESRLDSHPGLLSAGVTLSRGNDENKPTEV
jgi:hypothetical protein